MGQTWVTVEYKPAGGKRISVEVSPDVKKVLEETDRKLRSQERLQGSPFFKIITIAPLWTFLVWCFAPGLYWMASMRCPLRDRPCRSSHCAISQNINIAFKPIYNSI